MRQKRIYLNISELNLLLLAGSIFACSLVVIRVLWSLQATYISLIWNLFLAWIPHILSYTLRKNRTKVNNKILLYGWICLWLVFYPNAPYIITDLFHLNERFGAPLWFDLVLIYTFAGLGMILGLISLWDTHHVINDRFGNTRGWQFVFLVLLLSGFGIYLGRYMRWNSWDIISQTHLLTYDIWQIITSPIHNAKAYGFTIIFAFFQILVYYGFYRFIILIRKQRIFLT